MATLRSSAVVRDARPSDGAALARIYAPHVVDSAVSFEAEPPSAEVMAERIRTGQQTHPWLVATIDDVVVAYAYAGAFRAREAYAWTCESTVYVERPGMGLGRLLMTALLHRLERQGFATVVAGVTLPNPGSVGLHEALGFVACGRFPHVGHKGGAWHDVGFWSLDLAPKLLASATPPLPSGPTG